MNIATEKTVRDLAVENPESIRVFERLGIDYCCGGNKSVQSVCESVGISQEELLEQIARSAARFPRSDSTDWNERSLSELADYIVERHHAYVRQELPRLAQIARKVSGVHGSNHPEVVNVEKLFHLLATELKPHVLKEEQVLFPYLRQMEADLQNGKPLPAAFFGAVKNPIQAMVTEHDGAGELLKQLRKVTGDYALPPDACTTFRALYQGLEEFERDLHTHIHLENNILFPRALQRESAAQEAVRNGFSGS